MKTFERLGLIPHRGELRNFRTRRNLKLPLKCMLLKAWPVTKFLGNPEYRVRSLKTNILYRGRTYTVEFRAGGKAVENLVRKGIKRIQLYTRVIQSRMGHVAWILLAKEA